MPFIFLKQYKMAKTKGKTEPVKKPVKKMVSKKSSVGARQSRAKQRMDTSSGMDVARSSQARSSQAQSFMGANVDQSKFNPKVDTSDSGVTITTMQDAGWKYLNAIDRKERSASKYQGKKDRKSKLVFSTKRKGSGSGR
tara:strand:+ start:37 stop:453 length:417 start_codon:yes stop_codon:yes gene_type:complete